jgi:lipopolysaccharide transport system ATP-binding protein
MSNVAIRASGLGKRYRIRHQRAERYTTLRDVITTRVSRLFRPSLVERQTVEDFWALKDVSFEVQYGDIVGIIGRNGAGKSTLLKILSRITAPSAGRVHLFSNIASLLEVGTGFHPELTGRENIFLNGAILGMARAEMKRKFDEIVAFAEVEQFLDTPVKRYSSGMYVRLAFAVAAHVDPDILVIDEVLAVGDAQFQKKCLGKMRDVSRAGRTVLFVSHNMGAVQSLCPISMLLDGGQLAFYGNSRDAVARYLEGAASPDAESRTRSLSSCLSLTRLDLSPTVVRSGTSARLTIEIQASADDVISDLALLIHAPNGERVALVDLRTSAGVYRLRRGNSLVLSINAPNLPFVEMDYSLGLYVNATSVCDSFMSLRALTVLPGDSAGSVTSRDPQFRGVVELGARVEARVLPDSPETPSKTCLVTSALDS